jgi:hypothetical protein
VLSLFLFAWIGDSVAHQRTAGFDLAVRNRVHSVRLSRSGQDNGLHFVSGRRRADGRRDHFGHRVSLAALAARHAVDGRHHSGRPGPGPEPEICLPPPPPHSVLCARPSHLQFSQRTLPVFILLLWRARGIADAPPQIPGRANSDLDTALLVLVAAIGLSRIYLGVHYPSDVIAGYLAASLWVSTLVALDRARVQRKNSSAAED